MKKLLFWLAYSLITIALLGYFIFSPQADPAGDIVEYHGITESILLHGSVELQEIDQANLSQALSPGYFEDPGYYIEGRNDNRYPVHFIFYSIIAVPVRLLLKLLSENELNTLRVTNVIIFSIANAYILWRFIKDTFKQWVYVVLVYLSPLIWFLVWPGPDVYSMSLLLLSIFFFFNKKYISASILAALASWHSQPLLIVSIGTLMYWLGTYITFSKKTDSVKVIFPLRTTIVAFCAIGVTIAVPYMYNVWAFGVLSPWTILQDGWTQLYGFGVQNISIKKFIEQWTDPNMGLFWYAPVLFVAGIILWTKDALKNKNAQILGIIIILTALMYQTNPGWHYGTSGYGPGRHALFLLPVLIYFLFTYVKKSTYWILLLIVYSITQLYILSFNNYLKPHFSNTLSHSPYALFILDQFPTLYNPTPEIFIDRTTESDITYPHTAIYESNDECKKVYAISTDKDKLINECGYIPSNYESFFDNAFKRKSNVERLVYVVSATLWPDAYSCLDEAGDDYQYTCIRTVQDAQNLFADRSGDDRIIQVNNENGEWMYGVWRVEEGMPINLTIPPGYIVDYQGVDGLYIDY